MKKFKKIVVSIVILTFVLPSYVFGQDRGIQVKYNDRYLELEVLQENYIMYLPLRSFFEEIEGNVDWQPDRQSIIVEYREDTLELQANNHEVLKNGKTVYIDYPVVVKDSKSYISVGGLAQLLGFKSGYSYYTSTLTIVDLSELFDGIEMQNQELMELMVSQQGNKQLEVIQHFIDEFISGSLKADLDINGNARMNEYEEIAEYSGKMGANVEILTNETDYSILADYQIQIEDQGINKLIFDEKDSMGVIKLGDHLYEKCNDIWYLEDNEFPTIGNPYAALLDINYYYGMNSMPINEDTYEIAKHTIDSIIEILEEKEIEKKAVKMNGETVYKYHLQLDKEDFTALALKIGPRLSRYIGIDTLVELNRWTKNIDGNIDFHVYLNGDGDAIKEQLIIDIQYVDKSIDQLFQFKIEADSSLVNGKNIDLVESTLKLSWSNDAKSWFAAEMKTYYGMDFDTATKVIIEPENLTLQGEGSFKILFDDGFMSIDIDMDFNVNVEMKKEEVEIKAPIILQD
ncbi:MAG: copper amine oxidase N-terminal domain-containing protein [Clostridiaceae bacterium]|nr:copper amine oxidase N-terminal domain-containing protein [Clostridiaceae bacterium]